MPMSAYIDRHSLVRQEEEGTKKFAKFKLGNVEQEVGQLDTDLIMIRFAFGLDCCGECWFPNVYFWASGIRPMKMLKRWNGDETALF